MQFSNNLGLFLIARTATAVIPPKWNDGSIYMNKCGAATFISESSKASPSTGDCLEIVKYFNNHQGGFFVNLGFPDGNNYETLRKEGHCSFGIKQKNSANGATSLYFGGDDVRDIVADAVEKFEAGGRVGGRGTVECKGTKYDWAINNE